MKECSKAMFRRLTDTRYVSRYFVGNGIDVGAGTDSVSLYKELFPLMGDVMAWDMPQGDAQYLATVADNQFNFLHSSHCLEHMVDPMTALKHWFRVIKEGGHMVLLVPDEDLYEQGYFPSKNNSDHKWTFTMWKQSSWSNKSINVFDLIKILGETAQPLKVELLDGTYRYNMNRLDQTLTPIGECAIEIVIRKRTAKEIAEKGRLNPEGGFTKEDIFALTGIRVG